MEEKKKEKNSLHINSYPFKSPFPYKCVCTLETDNFADIARGIMAYQNEVWWNIRFL